MHIGIPREIKDGEGRVGATPEMVAALVQKGHRVSIEKGAGFKAGYPDQAYREVGGEVVSAAETYAASLVVKVKEPQREEWPYLRRGQILFCYLHLAANPLLERYLKEEGVLAVAYETVEDEAGGLPLLAPMSRMAGKIAVQEGAHLLGTPQGGKGVLIGMGRVLILGAGSVGSAAAHLAVGMGGDVTILDNRVASLTKLKSDLPPIKTDEIGAIEKYLPKADLMVGATLIPGKETPQLITKKGIGEMEKGSAFVDVSIDQGGCSETSKPTSHSSPTYVEAGVVHYCVTNIPGAFPKSATDALCKATLPFVLKMAG